MITFGAELNDLVGTFSSKEQKGEIKSFSGRGAQLRTRELLGGGLTPLRESFFSAKNLTPRGGSGLSLVGPPSLEAKCPRPKLFCNNAGRV